MIKFTIKTWRCPDCDYAQDFEPTEENMRIHFNGWGVRENECPACVSGRNPQRVVLRGPRMSKETRPEKKSKMTVLEESDVPQRVAEINSEPIQEGESLEEHRKRLDKEIANLNPL